MADLKALFAIPLRLDALQVKPPSGLRGSRPNSRLDLDPIKPHCHQGLPKRAGLICPVILQG
jgi:hypothetical protein